MTATASRPRPMATDPFGAVMAVLSESWASARAEHRSWLSWDEWQRVIDVADRRDVIVREKGEIVGAARDDSGLRLAFAARLAHVELCRRFSGDARDCHIEWDESMEIKRAKKTAPEPLARTPRRRRGRESDL